MKSGYLKFVQWSEPDRLFVGYCPDLFIGGVCHGADEQKVYRELSRLVAAEPSRGDAGETGFCAAKGRSPTERERRSQITESQRVKRPLPRKAALVTLPVAA